MIEAQNLKAKFNDIFGVKGHADTEAVRVFRAPGRVNLIGEHTDYNDGFVLPLAINFATQVAARARRDSIVRVHSLNRDETVEFNLQLTKEPPPQGWQAYVEGIAHGLLHHGMKLTGADMVLISDVPEGAGLSSSAALEISVGLALATLSGEAIEPLALARAGQWAEHNFVGTRSGIMDQYVAAMGAANHALLIDCRSLRAELVPLDTARHAVIVCNTGVKHRLASSEYNTRRAECEQAVAQLKKSLPHITALRDVSLEDFQAHQHLLPETIKRRARHVVTENQRTLDAVEALRRGDVKTFGELMFQSHESLRDDYEVSCQELDVMVEIARRCEGVAGGRMTGGGFGGCTVNLVKRDAFDDFEAIIKREYRQQTQREATLYRITSGDGAREIR